MLKRTVQWLIVVGLVVGTIMYATAKGPNGTCVDQRVRFCDEETACTTFAGACVGNCECYTTVFFSCPQTPPPHNCSGTVRALQPATVFSGTCVINSLGTSCICRAGGMGMPGLKPTDVCVP